MEPYCVKFPMHLDSRGALTACQSVDDIPFDIKRVLWITHVPSNQIRGGNAHRECHQIFIAVTGSVRLRSGGKSYTLIRPDIGVHVPPGNYVELDRFQPYTVVLVLCSHAYNAEDYSFP